MLFFDKLSISYNWILCDFTKPDSMPKRDCYAFRPFSPYYSGSNIFPVPSKWWLPQGPTVRMYHRGTIDEDGGNRPKRGHRPDSRGQWSTSAKELDDWWGNEIEHREWGINDGKTENWEVGEIKNKRIKNINFSKIY